MDPNLIYSRYRDDAFAMQLAATEYSVFVAMPFRNRFSYRADDVYKDVMQAAAKRANELLTDDPGKCGARRFGTPLRIDDQPQTGRDIGGEIAKAILHAHFVLADLSFANDGVMLEVGLALALKPTTHVVLITQHPKSDLHFDISSNVVIEYPPSGNLLAIATAMVAAAKDFEERRNEYLTQLSKDLSSDAIRLMNWYGRCANGRVLRDRDGSPLRASLYEHVGVLAFIENHAIETARDIERFEAMTRYQLAMRELLAKRLIWTDYRPQTPRPGVDSFSSRGTKLGWMFITHKWPDLSCPPGEFPDNNGA